MSCLCHILSILLDIEFECVLYKMWRVHCTNDPCVLYEVCQFYCIRCTVCFIQSVQSVFYIFLKYFANT